MARVLKKCIGCDQTYDLLKSIHCPDCGDFDEDIEIAKRANQEGWQARLDLERFSQEANEKAQTSPTIEKMRAAFGAANSQSPKSVDRAMAAYAERAATLGLDIGLIPPELMPEYSGLDKQLIRQVKSGEMSLATAQQIAGRRLEAHKPQNQDLSSSTFDQQLVDLRKEMSKRNKSTWTQLMERFSKMGKQRLY